MRQADDVTTGEAEAQSRLHNTSLLRENGKRKKGPISGIRNFGHIIVSRIVWAASMCAFIVAASLLMLT
jgi:hypothetical protein